MKAKNLSKVLAFLVAAVMIFSALPLMAFAADEATPYTVSFGAPAIPMNVNTKVDLKTLAVEMTDSLKYDDAGTVSGADVTWAAADQAGLIFDATAKTVEVTAVGNYKLTATANGITKNVWVIAKEAAATDFNIVNYDFTKAGSFNASEWHLLEYKSDNAAASGTVKPMDGTYAGFKDTTEKGYLTVGSGSCYVILINKNEIFKDFRDYTITYHGILATGNNQHYNGLGFGARMVLDNDGVLDLETNSFIGISSGNGLMRMQSHSGTDWWGQFTSNQDQKTSGKENYYWYQNKPHTISGKFDGENLFFTRDDTVVYDLSAHANGKNDFMKNKNNAYAIELGYPGIRNEGGEGHIDNFIVKLNSTDMPATMTDEPENPDPTPSTPAAGYTVSYAAPAIPMNVYTKLDLKTIAVEMVKGEAAVSGADITWAAAAQDGLTFDATNKTVEVAKVGNYKLTATANGVTKNVWVVVKTEEQDKFYLVNIPVLNQDSFVVEDWRLVGGKNDTELTVQDCIDQGNIAFTSSSMVIRNSIGSSKKGGALIYVNEIFKDFADYTVETYSANAAVAAVQNVTDVGNGSIGRITLNDSETGWVTGVMSFVRNNEQISISRTAVPKVDFGGFSPAAAFDGAWKVWNGSEGNHHTVKTVFDGSKVLFYLNDTLLLDSTTEPKYEAQITTHHDGAGYPGMVAYGTSGRFREFYVYLNSTEMPAAEKVTPPTPTPDPDPTPGTKPSKPNSPQTGDNTNLALWAALLFVSGLGIFAITLFGRNKREEN